MTTNRTAFTPSDIQAAAIIASKITPGFARKSVAGFMSGLFSRNPDFDVAAFHDEVERRALGDWVDHLVPPTPERKVPEQACVFCGGAAIAAPIARWAGGTTRAEVGCVNEPCHINPVVHVTRTTYAEMWSKDSPEAVELHNEAVERWDTEMSFARTKAIINYRHATSQESESD